MTCQFRDEQEEIRKEDVFIYRFAVDAHELLNIEIKCNIIRDKYNE